MPSGTTAAAVGLGHILDASTLGLWRFDDTAADDATLGAADSGVNGKTLTVSGAAPGYRNGPVSGTFARHFQNGGATPTDGNGFTRTGVAADATLCVGSWTVEMFIKLGAFAVAGQLDPIITYGGVFATETEVANQLMCIRVTETGKISILHENLAGVDNLCTQTAGVGLTVGTWTHLAVVKDSVAKTYKVYVGGTLQDTLSYANEATGGTTTPVWSIGLLGTAGSRHLSGVLSDIRVSNIARSGATITADAALISTTGQHAVDANTYAMWRLNEVPTARDAGTNGYHLQRYVTPTATVLTEATSPLISDGGRARAMVGDSHFYCTFESAIRSAFLADFTFETWRLFTSLKVTTNTTAGLFMHGNATGGLAQTSNIWGASVNGDGSIVWDMERGAVTHSSYTTAAGVVKCGVPQHIAIRKTTTNTGGAGRFRIDVFVNGVQVGTQDSLIAGDGSTSVETSVFHIGRGGQSSDNPGRGMGVVDDTRFSSVARTDAEIRESYERGALQDFVYPYGIACVAAVGSPVVIPDDTTIRCFGIAPVAAVGTPFFLDPQDSIDPTIENLDPDPSAGVRAATVISFDITDDAFGGLVMVALFASFPDGTAELIHDGTSFRGAYLGASNTRTGITDGYHFTVLRDGGWTQSPTIEFLPVDSSGNIGVVA